MEKDKPQITNNFNAPIYNYGTLQGDVTNNFYGNEQKKPHTDQEIREALLALMKVKNEEGEVIFQYDYQWYGVMRVLSEFHDYPSAPKDFEKTIANLNLGKLANPCKYDNFRRIPTNCPRLAKPNVWLWKDLKSSASGQELEVIDAALKLMELLKV